MQQKYLIFVSPNEILSVKSFGLTLFDITAYTCTFCILVIFKQTAIGIILLNFCMLQMLPSVVCSHKQGYETTNYKFGTRRYVNVFFTGSHQP